MPKVYVYDSYDNKFFRYTLRENDHGIRMEST